MTTFQITCIVDDSNKVITHVGLGSTQSKITVQTAVDDLRSPTGDRYYTMKDGKRADVYAKQHPSTGRWFLTTNPDDTRENNLDFLPKCT